MSARITPRQAECLEHIERLIAERGYPPSFRELGAALGVRSKHAVNCLLVALERAGYITRARDRARGIRVVRPSIKDAPPDIKRELGSAHDELQEIAAVCARHGFDSSSEDVADFLERRLAHASELAAIFDESEAA